MIDEKDFKNMGNCHEADTDLTGLCMPLKASKPSHIVFIVYENQDDMEKGTLKQAFDNFELAKEYAAAFPDALIQKVLLHYIENSYFEDDDKL